MPRYYKRRYKRAYKKSRLTKSKIFSKKSAKSQASQIYALKKKIDYVYKSTKPDTDTGTASITPSSSLTFSGSSVVNYILSQINIIDNNTLTNIGTNIDYINIKNIKFQFLYRFNSLSDSTQPIYIRLTFLKLRTATSSLITPTNVFSNQSDPYIKVRGPLRDGLYDSGYKVVGDYKRMISKDRPNLNFVKYFKGFKLDKGNGTFPKNSLWCCVYIWNPNYSDASNHSEGQAFYKFAYTQPSKIVGQV